MAIIKVRYRNITYQELREAHAGQGECTEEMWNSLRGKEFLIRTPPVDPSEIKTIVEDETACGGPYYDEVGNYPYVTCHHEAEIGD